MENWIYALLSVFIVSAISFVGVLTLGLKRDKLQKILFILVSFSVGALFGDVFIHLIPGTFEELGIDVGPSLLILLGIIIFFSMEKFIRWRHCHVSDSKSHEHSHPLATMNLLGDGVHNFVDGLLIGASFFG